LFGKNTKLIFITSIVYFAGKTELKSKEFGVKDRGDGSVASEA